MPATALITSSAARPATPSAYLAAHEKFEQLITRLRAPLSQAMTHSELEQLIETEGREVLRHLLQAHLNERSPGTVTSAVRGAAGQLHTHQRSQTRELESIFGAVTLTRTGYGGRGLRSLHPLDAALNLPSERYSHTVRRRAAALAAVQSFDEVVAALTAHTGAHVPKRQVEELIRRAARDFDAFYAASACRHAQRGAGHQSTARHHQRRQRRSDAPGRPPGSDPTSRRDPHLPT